MSHSFERKKLTENLVDFYVNNRVFGMTAADILLFLVNKSAVFRAELLVGVACAVIAV